MRLLWLSDSPLLGTGFGRVTREVASRLARVPSIEVASLGWNYDGWPYDRARYPFTIYPSQGPSQQPENFERIVHDFRPDVVVTLGEIWMVEWLHTHAVRGQFKWIAYVPIDGGPFYPPWEPMLKNVDELVAMSEFGREVLQQGVPARRVHVIHHGVDTSVFRPLVERPRLKLHDRFRDKFVVGCVARNQARKNIPALVKAFAQLSTKINNLHLYLHMNPCDVGYDIVTLLRRHKLEGRADVSGPDFSLHQPLEDEQLNRLYNLFDVTVLPSMGEGFGLPLIESMAAGVPVVATDYSACSELVRGRGELVRVLTTVTMGTNLIEQAVIDTDDLANCIEKLYQNPKLILQHAAEGLAFARPLSWDALIPKWLELLSLTAGVDLVHSGMSRQDAGAMARRL